jgi:hypothetical protein
MTQRSAMQTIELDDYFLAYVDEIERSRRSGVV